MFKKFVIIFAVCLLGLSTSTADAEVIISVEADGSTVTQTGTAGAGKTVDFFLSQTSGSSDVFFGSFGEIAFEAGAITSVTIGSTDPAVDNGFLGEGNLSTSDAIIDMSNQFFTFNQEFTDSMQEIPVQPDSALWLSLELDTTGLADGRYRIDLRPDPEGNFFDSDVTPVPSNSQLFFDVGPQMIPEPSSLALFGVLTLAGAIRRKRSIA